MGRDCGYLALMSGLATGAEHVYLPEEGVSLAESTEDVPQPKGTCSYTARLMVTALVVLDGLRPDAIPLASTPHLDAFSEAGSSTMSAVTVVPPVTLPAHTSMLTSVPPSDHGVIDNTWNPAARTFANFVDQVALAGKPPVAFYTWEPLRDLWSPGSMAATWYRNLDWRTDGDHYVAEAVGEFFRNSDAEFAFVYLGSIDIAGHLHGWMSDAYLDQIGTVDDALGGVLEGLGSGATAVVTSDHGGHDRVHGIDHPDDLTIPWLIAGPGIRRNHRLASDVSLLDTAPTLAHAMGLNSPSSWQGQAVFEAFEV